MKQQPTTEREELFWQQGKLVAGVDEAGRGCLAGPVVAAAVILRPENIPAGLHDSKQLSPQKREQLFAVVQEHSIARGVGTQDERAVEQLNIVQATMRAMHDAIGALQPQPEHLLIDGNYFRNATGIAHTTVISGDALVVSIAAASILAKVTRDTWMVEVADAMYPQYGFAQHKGYGTKLHKQALAQFGPCPLHRQTFLTRTLELFAG